MTEQMMHPVAERALAYFDDLFPEEAVDQHQNAHQFLAELENFKQFGTDTFVSCEGGIPYYVNEYWTSGQRKGHSIHEISYRACFKPQLPKFFIERLTEPGDLVYDPFMGRGTTPVEASLLARRPVANDINPLSTILTRPRLNPPSLADVSAKLEEVPWDRAAEMNDELLVFYHPDTLKQLMNLRAWLLEQAPLYSTCPDPAVDWIRMVALNRLTGHSAGFFSVYTLPPNQAVSLKAQKKINLKRQQQPQAKDVAAIILKKSRSLFRDRLPLESPNFHLLCGKAHHSPEIEANSVSLVVTSPPFLDIVQYADDNWLRCWFAGIDVSSVDIAMHKTEDAWTKMVANVLAEQARILKPGGHVAFEVGEVRNGKVLLEQLVWKAAEDLPFERIGVMVNQQEFTKTANCWGVANNSKGTNSNRIVLLQKI